MNGECTGPDRILNIGFAFRQSKVLLSAVELDLFTALGNGPAECGELTARVKMHQRGARDFFDVLVALQLLQRDVSGRYSNTPDGARYLNRRSPDYIGGLFEHLNGRMYSIWSHLGEALRSGLPQSGALADGGYDALYANKIALGQFLRAMTGGSLLPARALASKFAWQQYTHFIDIGTAQGCVPVEIARSYPHLTGGGFDLPAIANEFAAYVNEHDLGARLKFHPGDFLKSELPSADVLIMGRILHNWGIETKRLLLEKAYRTLPEAGALIVYDPMIDELRSHSPALFAGLTMLLETPEGFEYTASECRNWMTEAGFGETMLLPLDVGHLAVIGYK